MESANLPNLGGIQPPFSNSQTLAIPDDLIFEHILPRLPVKSLIQFNSVCKSWYNFISSSQFAKSHLKFSSASPHFLLLKDLFGIQGIFREFNLLSYDEHDENMRLAQLDYQLPEFNREYYVVGCCNGLICFYFYEALRTVKFILWNPATRKCRIISTDFRETLLNCGFGYASTLEDYKIFGAFYSYADTCTRVRVFSLTLGEWKQICLSKDDVEIFYSACGMKGVFVDTSLYWYVNKSGGLLRIICYNLVNEQLREFPVTIECFYDCVEIEVFKGCLLLRCYENGYDPSLCEVWILKKQDDINSWEKLFSFPFYYAFTFGFLLNWQEFDRA